MARFIAGIPAFWLSSELTTQRLAHGREPIGASQCFASCVPCGTLWYRRQFSVHPKASILKTHGQLHRQDLKLSHTSIYNRILDCWSFGWRFLSCLGFLLKAGSRHDYQETINGGLSRLIERALEEAYHEIGGKSSRHLGSFVSGNAHQSYVTRHLGLLIFAGSCSQRPSSKREYFGVFTKSASHVVFAISDPKDLASQVKKLILVTQ